MRLSILHDTTYRYAQAPYLMIQALRMWPADSRALLVKDWCVEIDGKRLHPTCRDGFGNPVATHTIDRNADCIRISIRGEVETEDLHGVHGEGNETLPPMFYLRPTGLTAGNDAIDALARAEPACDGDIDRLHSLSNRVRDHVDYLPDTTDAESTAAEAFEAGAGVCQDHAHVLIAAARALGFPGRYVSGYLCPAGEEAAASHAWAEIFVEGLGWVGFDAANRQSPDERYVRIACGRDYRDAAPIRGVRLGGESETMEVDVSIVEGGRASSQSQTQATHLGHAQ
ncbi:transglutaminase family protein [Luteimonas vadosa]|uniref:Transglutaminase family protein n=1 Tax=Luteimonas vadosa TaxID=1165507 RepID=A0ABP9E451_9GAMM